MEIDEPKVAVTPQLRGLLDAVRDLGQTATADRSTLELVEELTGRIVELLDELRRARARWVRDLHRHI